MTKGLKHTNGNVIVVKDYEIRHSANEEHYREANIAAYMYKDSQHALRDQNGTLSEWDFPIKRKSWNIPDPIAKLSGTTTLPIGEAVHEAIYDFVLTKAGKGWSKI